MAKQRWYVGVNGSHTESTAFALSDDFEAAGVACGDSLNLHSLPVEQVTDRLENLLDQLVARLALDIRELRSTTKRLVLSMPGAATFTDQAMVGICLSNAGWKDSQRYLVWDDTWAGLVAGTGSYLGTCAFAGTGASVYVQVEESQEAVFIRGKPNKIDGWGPTIGDFGSGFQLATDTFRLFNRELDKGNTPDLFRFVLEQEPRIKDISNSQQWFDAIYSVHPRQWRVKFAELAAAVTRAAEMAPPDMDAKKLVEKAAHEMIYSIELAVKRFPMATRLPIVFHGGMFEHSQLYLHIVSDAARSMTTGRVYLCRFRPVIGAVLGAIGGTNGLPSQQVIGEVKKRVLAMRDEDKNRLFRRQGEYPF